MQISTLVLKMATLPFRCNGPAMICLNIACRAKIDMLQRVLVVALLTDISDAKLVLSNRLGHRWTGPKPVRSARSVCHPHNFASDVPANALLDGYVLITTFRRNDYVFLLYDSVHYYAKTTL